MKKISLLFAAVAIASGSFAQANSGCTTCETAPNLIKSQQNYDKALWTVQLDANPVNIGDGLAACVWTGTEFWVADWRSASPDFHVANNLGVKTSSFTISGLTGCRSMTTDGTNIYAGNNTSTIYVINPATKAVTSTISTGVTNIRYCAYDASLNSSAGGFWVGAWGSAITAVSMSGATLTTIAAGTHGLTGVYGMAVDPYSTGGPYLWAFDQGGNGANIVQLSSTGVPTGLVHDATSDLSTAGIAGGLGIYNNFVSGKNSIIGISQGGSLFAYELADPFAIDAQMDALNLNAYIAAGNVTISGTVKNVGLTTLTSIDINWDAGSGPNNQNFSVSIPANGTYNFNHGTQLTAVAGNTYSIDVSVTASGDGSSLNDTLTANVTALSSIPAKKTVGEEKTGTWCGWCPRGAVGLAYMEAQNDFIGIAVHNNDAMQITAYDNGINTYIPGGYPGGGVDRVLEGDPNPNSFLAMHNSRKTAIVPCDVKNIVATLNGANISVSADSEWYGSIPGNFRLSCVIVEDDLNSTNQTNYYGAGGSGGPGGINDNGGPMAFPTGINNSFDFYGAATSVPSASFLGYDHVAKSLSSNDILGDAGSLPAGTVPVGTHSYTFANVPSSVVSNYLNAHAVVMVVDASTGEILNAEIASITTANSIDDLEAAQIQLKVYPNPTNNVSTISFNLKSSESVSLEVYNAMGSLVYAENGGVMNAGNQKFTFNGSELTSGFYFVNLTVGNKVISKKVSLLK